MQKVFAIPLAVREGTAHGRDFFNPWRLQNRREEGGLGEPLAQGVGLEACRLPELCLLSLEPGVCCLPGSSGVDLQITSWPWVMWVKARVRSWGYVKQHNESQLQGWGDWNLLLWDCLSSS